MPAILSRSPFVNHDMFISRTTMLNNQPLAMPDDHTLPELKPVSLPAGQAISLPSLSYAFYVIPDANVKACM